MGHLPAFVALLLFYTLNSSLLVTSQECTIGELRTVPEDNGRVYPQYCLNGEWKRMCAGDSTWTTKTATVACRQLGYIGLIAFNSGCPTGPGADRSDGEVRLFASCNGTENRLKDCGDGVMVMPCRCEVRAYLECEPGNCACREIRLMGGSTNSEGRVEVCIDGRWGTVCNNKQEGIAEAVCSQLGFLRQNAATVNSFGSGFVPIRNCSVTEEGNLTCNQITDGSCDHSMDLGVVCRTYEQLYNELRDQMSSMQGTPSTCPSITMSANRDSTSSNRALIAIIVVLGALLIAMAIGWICSCVVMMKKINNLETSASKTAAVTTEERQLQNPVYDGTTQQKQPVPKPGPTYKTVQSQKATVTSPGAAEVTYDVADERGGVTYSVVGEAADTNSQPYNVLVHNTERSPCFVPQEDYSTLQA